MKPRNLLEQIMRFGAVGVLCFVIDYAVYRLLNFLFEHSGVSDRFAVYYYVSAALAFTVSVVVNYLLSMRFVFTRREGLSRRREFVVFVVLSIGGLIVNELCMLIGMEGIYAHWAWLKGIMSFDFAKDIFFKFGATGVVMVYNFITRKIFIEGRSDAGPFDEAQGPAAGTDTEPVEVPGSLHGSLIDLRPITPDDTDDFLRWRNAPAVRERFIIRSEVTKEQHEKWLSDQVATGRVVQFIICEKTGRGVGCVYLRDIDYKEGTAEYGVLIGESDALGKGYGSEAARLMLAHAFNTMGLKTIRLRVYTDNAAAIASYRQAGFKEVKTLQDVESTDGTTAQMLLMEATK